MSDLPKRVQIDEEGPREGFQIETAAIPTARKVELIEALAETGVERIDCVSYVDPRRVPGMADAEAVARTIRRRPGVRYTGLWLNMRGFERALALPLDRVGTIRITASDTFSRRNTGLSTDQTVDEQRRWLAAYRDAGIPLEWGYVMTAFGCNYEGPVPVERVVAMVERLIDLAAEAGVALPAVSLADTVGWATPRDIEFRVGAVRERWPELRLGLHLHDTRGTGMANAYAALRMGVDQFDAACGGLGGCPFAGHKGAAGNICTEDLVFMCEEMGVSTGIDLERLRACAHLAESIVGHPLPGKVMNTGGLHARAA